MLRGGKMIYYKMNCPVHNSNVLETFKTIEYLGKKVPVFECEICKKYYLYNKEKSGAVVAILGDRKVFASNIPYKVGNYTFEKPKPDNKPTFSIKYEETVVRVRLVKDDEVPKVKKSLLNIRNEFPGIMTDNMTVSDFMFKVFKFSSQVVRVKVDFADETKI